ncbi:CPBP family intramembrane glutamic endopeptidase [Agathobaculum sp.]|uniref:CPBP family intramembrane glutamic endopeptidase n=1 Tax=Agathobaculum sp. TaxID=2048138 RepID=UPI002A82B4F4|nr:type II CAAX endopeptidase family protein [Agathobaculum sp.]MDY3618287.1 type II CAAX endopeptidase family protein [Agathobaculum sp.]
MEEFDARAERKYCSRIGFSLVVTLACALVWQFAVMWVDYLTQGGIPETIYYILILAGHYAVALPLALRLTRCVPRTPAPQQEWGMSQIAKWFFIGMAVMWLGAFVGTAVNNLAYGLIGRTPVDALNEVFDLLPPAAAILSACVLAPICEEFLFRGVIADRLARYGQGRAAVISALLFGLFHGNLTQFFYAFGLGLLLAAVYFKTGQLIVPITLHTLYNVCGSGVPLLIGSRETGMIVYGLLVLACLIAGGVLLILELMNHGFCLEDGPLSGAPGRVIWLNAGMTLALIVCLMQFIIVFLSQ